MRCKYICNNYKSANIIVLFYTGTLCVLIYKELHCISCAYFYLTPTTS
jgi:hypothetical protein